MNAATSARVALSFGANLSALLPAVILLSYKALISCAYFSTSLNEVVVLALLNWRARVKNKAISSLVTLASGSNCVEERPFAIFKEASV